MKQVQSSPDSSRRTVRFPMRLSVRRKNPYLLVVAVLQLLFRIARFFLPAFAIGYFINTVVPPYPRVIRYKTYRGYVKPRIIPSAIYNVITVQFNWWITRSKTLPTLNKVVIKCTAHYIVHLQCTLSFSLSLSLSHTYESKGFWRFSLILKMCQLHTCVCMYVHIGRIWAAGFHHVTARSRLARGLKLVNRLFL
jgi:hypothetical protein